MTLCNDFLEDLLVTFFAVSVCILSSLPRLPHPTPDLMELFVMSSIYFTAHCVLLHLSNL